MKLDGLNIPGAESCWAAYREWGSGMPVLFLHGFMATHANWWPIMQRLGSDYRCIALDLLGFGQSSQPALRYDIAAEVEFVRGFVQALGLSSLVLVGHSFGGWVGAAYGVRYPLQGLVLLAPAGIRDDSFVGRYNHLRPLLWETPWVDRLLQAAIPLARWWHQEDRLAQILWLRGSLRQQPVARQFLLHRLRPEDAVDTVENQIHRIQAPTLVIAAEEDDTIPLWHCQTYAERIPEAQLKILPAASHAIPAFHAESVLPLIQEFLTSISTSISTTNAIKKTTARYQQQSQQPKGGLPLPSFSE
ncbi:alpha/beta hydrolase [Synechococcus bigranulatus str. 'Rupite']|uniref:Alpha/beta hydrolase n=1 Tax=Thermostichus vulcanus str. 'Rupite' TaxID=2813851 RepID=A0ABT0CCS2_THEVL|nr:alpha/beta hydrolase [Thermostichus vulcanus str. 'Rupite']